MNIGLLKTKALVKGIFSNSMPYIPLLETGDSSPYFGTYEGQKYGPYDTSCCWDFAACELAETRLEMLWKMNLIPQDTMNWLEANGYLDQDGDFYLSRRWVAILSGVKNAGNQEINFWNIASVAGLIPNWMLPYSQKDAFDEVSQNDFNNEYFDPKVITLEMELMGKEFARRFKIKGESLSGGFFNDVQVKLQTYLKEGSLQIAVPVPQDGSWNQSKVKWMGRKAADHSIELYKFDSTLDYPYFVYDSYEPHLKQLSKDYFIPIITRVSIQPTQSKPVTTSTWQKFWFNVDAWLNKWSFSYPEVPIG